VIADAGQEAAVLFGVGQVPTQTRGPVAVTTVDVLFDDGFEFLADAFAFSVMRRSPSMTRRHRLLPVPAG